MAADPPCIHSDLQQLAWFDGLFLSHHVNALVFDFFVIISAYVMWQHLMNVVC